MTCDTFVDNVADLDAGFALENAQLRNGLRKSRINSMSLGMHTPETYGVMPETLGVAGNL